MTENYLDEIPECPLCLEPLGLDDINFYPCACRYQICRFCWHRIRTDENGLCPHCREVYPEDPAEYTPPTQEQLAKTRSEKKQKELCKRQKVVESRERLGAVRVVQRNLVFVIGLSPRLADPEVLKKTEYFGKYGKIYKVVINNHTIYNGAQGPSVSAYVTYCRSEDASKAIAAVNNAFIDGRSLKASFGTTKYCSSFLKGTLCTKPDCMYLHELGEDEASFTKEDMQLGKHQVFENATLASLLPVGSGSAKDHAPSMPAEGGVKIKHTVLPPRNKEPTQSDLAESALPASAHWASNQKLQSESDQTHSNPKPASDSSGSTAHSSSSKQAKSATKSHSNSTQHGPGTEHIGKSSKRTQKEPLRQDLEDNLKSQSRPGSVSPNTQKTGQARTLEVTKKEPGGMRTGHSRGSSLTKSVTPNMSPSSSLTTSSSSGSLRQEAEVGGNSGPGKEVCEDEEEKRTRLLQCGAQETRENEAAVSNRTDSCLQVQPNPRETLQEVPSLSGSAEGVSSLRPPLTSCVSPGVGGNSPPISSPPGLSKTRTQPLPLNSKSEVVCRQLNLEDKPVPSSVGHSVHLGNQVTPAMLTGHLMPIQAPMVAPHLLVSGHGVGWPGRAGLGGGRSSDELGHISSNVGVRGRGRGFISMSSEQLEQVGRGRGGGCSLISRGGVRSTEQLGTRSRPLEQKGEDLKSTATNGVISSLTSAGPGHFGALGGNWSHPGLPNSIPTVPSSPLNASTVSVAHSSSHPASTQLTNPSPPTSSLQSGSIGPPLPMTANLKVDDGDDLGFDPWDVSQQGLADLLEREQEQKRPHLPGATHNHSNPAHPKKVSNGLTTPFAGQGAETMYNNWYSHGGVEGLGNVGGDSLQDEFRALFPNVNISFGGPMSKAKSERSSPLVQALDASNPAGSYVPSHLATALNYSYNPSPHLNPSSSTTLGHNHLMAGKQGEGSMPTNSQLQPGFPASCFRVKSHGGVGTATTTESAVPPASTVAVGGKVSTVNSYTNCLGPDWPDLGLTLGQDSKGVQKPAFSMETTTTTATTRAGQKEAGSETAATSVAGAMWKSADGAESTAAEGTAAAMPPPPPGFSKAHVEATPSSLAGGAGSATAGNQSITAANAMNHFLLANSKGQILSSQLLQSWRNLAGKLTPAQQQQLRNNQLTFQQQQQLLTQQYLFQQALMRNPVLQAQSLRMAQQFQQAALLQQQQALIAAGLKAGTINPLNSTTAARVNPTSLSTTSAAQEGSKLLVSMATGTASPPVTSVSASVNQSGSKVAAGNIPPKSAGKSQRQTVANSGLKGQAHAASGRSSGQTNARGVSSGHSKGSSQVQSNSGQSVPSVGLNSKGGGEKHHPRNSKSAAKPKGGSGAHHAASTGLDRKTRQKSSK